MLFPGCCPVACSLKSLTGSAWTKTAKDEWTAKIPFTKDANYTLNLTYTDLAGNSKTTDTIAFTVDTTAPAQPKIQYNKTWFASVVEGVTFGFFKAPIEVTVTLNVTVPVSAL